MVSYAAAALLASTWVVSASAGNAHGHHGHHGHHAALHPAPPSYEAPPFPVPGNDSSTCGCTTYTTTWYGAATLVQPPPETSTTTRTLTSTSTIFLAPTPHPSNQPKEKHSSSTSPSTAPAAPTHDSKPIAPPPAPHAPAKNVPNPEAPPAKHAPTPETPPAENAPTPKTPPATPKSPTENKPSSPPTSDKAGGKAPIAPSGNKWAMTYTPYTETGSCKDAASVHADIASIKAMGFNTVRLYATDCSGITNVGSACKSTGMKLIMGIYIDASGLKPAYSQLTELTSWGKANTWDLVEMVVAGNEAVFNGFTTASDLANFIKDARAAFRSAGYTGPVTTTEPLNIIQQYASTFCAAVDVIAANIHPFFNSAISASNAGSFVKSQLGDLSAACHGEKPAWCLETGWPSGGNANGAAIPGEAQQKAAIDSIVATVGDKCAIFSFQNDGWKHGGDLGVEQHFGCSKIFEDLL